MVGHRAKLAALAIGDKLLSISEFPLIRTLTPPET